MPRPGYVYILASQRNGTLYIGVTSNVEARVAQHRAGVTPGFTTRYGVHRRVRVEEYPDIRDAIQRERQLKKWRRAWKLDLIEQVNPDWTDLMPEEPASQGMLDPRVRGDDG